MVVFFPWVCSDVWKLGRDFDISVSSIVQNNIIELRAFANQVFGIRSNWSLERLVLYVVSHSFIIMSMTFDSQVETWKTLQKSTARGGSQFVHYWPGHVFLIIISTGYNLMVRRLPFTEVWALAKFCLLYFNLLIATIIISIIRSFNLVQWAFAGCRPAIHREKLNFVYLLSNSPRGVMPQKQFYLIEITIFKVFLYTGTFIYLLSALHCQVVTNWNSFVNFLLVRSHIKYGCN